MIIGTSIPLFFQKVDETGNLHMELIPPEPQVWFRQYMLVLGWISGPDDAELNVFSCYNDLLNGRFGSSIAPLSGITLLLIFQGEESTRQDFNGLVKKTAGATVVFKSIATDHICSYFRMMLVHLGLPQWQMRCQLQTNPVFLLAVKNPTLLQVHSDGSSSLGSTVAHFACTSSS